jgi:DDE family transposase
MQVTNTRHADGHWTAGGFSSFKAGKTITYGRMEFDARMEEAQGTMCAILMWPASDKLWTGIWGRGPEALARLEAHNAAVRRVRCRIEKVFGTWKRSYGLRRMRRLGLAKAGLQVRLAAMAHNLRRTATLLQGAAA